jgi:YHS domain-containing protein
VCKKELIHVGNINLPRHGKIVRLCSIECKRKFDSEPEKYLK